MFCGAGGTKGSNGIGILLNRRLVHGFRAFHATGKRLRAMDVDVLGQRFRFISVYMPHGGYDDEDVEGVYSQLDELLRRARNKYRVSIFDGRLECGCGHSRDW